MKNVISVDFVLETILCSKLVAILDFDPFNDELDFLLIISSHLSPSKTYI